MGRIVVGVDGSEEARTALRWALGEAKVHGSTVESVYVWRYPVLAYAPGLMAPPFFAREDLETEARGVLDETVDGVLEAAGEDASGVAVERVVVEGAPAERLLERAEGADLLVVGHRGHGGFTELLLGSVAQQCAQHAPCPVAVIRAAVA